MLPLNEDQIRTLTSAIDRIVPADDYPSASDLGCADFLLALIASEGLSETYRAGLDGLNLESQKLGQKFSDLTPEAQDSILSLCEKRRVAAGWAVSPRKFFTLLARQTVEGYYADSGNGGNRGEVSWRMVGFEVRG